MTINFKHIALGATLLFGISSGLHAQSADFLNNYTDARSMAMGGTSMATGAVTFNPAAAIQKDGNYNAQLNFLGVNPTELKAQGSLSFSARIGNRFAVSVFGNAFIKNPYPYYDEGGMVQSTIRPINYMAGVGVSYLITEGLSVGINAKFIGLNELNKDMIELNPELQNPTAFAGDIALMYNVSDFTISAGVTNLGTKVSFDKTSSGYNLPSAARIGAEYSKDFGQHSLGAALDADYFIFNKEAGAGIGIEYGFREMLFGRAGFRYAIPMDDSKSIVGMPSALSVGLGYKVCSFTIDATYLVPCGDTALDGVSPLANTFMVTLGMCF